MLLWISNAIDEGRIQPSRAAHHSGGPDAAIHWLRSNYCHIPVELRPVESDIDEFASFFSTYLTSSFDIVEQPGTKGEGPTPEFCRCSVCMRIVNAPFLRAKKLFPRDKRRANYLMRQSLIEFAAERSVQLPDESAEHIVASESTRRSAAFITYGDWLIRRLSGESDGPAILALWRLIAWKPQGGIRPGFTLQVEDFIAAEEALARAIKEEPPTDNR